jgi:CDP-diacylglycerol--serine O-phosphatidyltransferase
MIGVLWAVFFDWSDGLIARRIPGRTQQQRAIGAQLDSLIDVVSFSVLPAVVLLSYGELSPWFIPGAFVILSTGVMRLSHFNVFGLADKSTYTGLALDNNTIVLAFVFFFEGLVDRDTFTVILYTTLMALAAMNVAPVRTPKLPGGWYYGLVVYVVVMTAVFGWRWTQSP